MLNRHKKKGINLDIRSLLSGLGPLTLNPPVALGVNLGILDGLFSLVNFVLTYENPENIRG